MNFKKMLLATLISTSTGIFAQLNINYFKDGPYVFHNAENQKIILKSITENGVQTQEFNENENITFNVKDPTSDKSFAVTLRKKHAIEPDTYPMPKKILFTSDLEGEFAVFKKILIDSGVMNENFEWTYGKGHLYCIGDMVDRGENVTEVLWLIYRLEAEAEKHGGKVHYIIGNHEFMSLENDQRYVHDKYKKNLAHIGLSGYGDFFNIQSEWGKWFRSKNLIEKIGNYTVVHAGVSPEVANLQLSYKEMNDFGRLMMNNKKACAENENCKKINGGSSVGLYWYRNIGYIESKKEANRAKAISQPEVEDILKKINSQKTIFGHTLTANNTITPLYQEKAINIDINHAENSKINRAEALIAEGKCFKKIISDEKGIHFESITEDCKNKLLIKRKKK